MMRLLAAPAPQHFIDDVHYLVVIWANLTHVYKAKSMGNRKGSGNQWGWKMLLLEDISRKLAVQSRSRIKMCTFLNVALYEQRKRGRSRSRSRINMMRFCHTDWKRIFIKELQQRKKYVENQRLYVLYSRVSWFFLNFTFSTSVPLRVVVSL
jgi:hypothetical protein